MKNPSPRPRTGGLSFKPVVKYIISLYVVLLIVLLAVTGQFVLRTMKQEADFVCGITKSHLDYRIHNTVALLSSLVGDSYFGDPTIPYPPKAAKLNQYSTAFGYMMVRIVDKDFDTWTSGGLSANLSSRAYMQRLRATGKFQVTDSFASGVDGITLNYTVAMPIYHDGQFDGCIFAAIYFDEVEERLRFNVSGPHQQLLLYGSEAQVMSVSDKSRYGTPYMEMMRGSTFLGTTGKQVEEDLYNQAPGSSWFWNRGNLYYAAYQPIAGAPWTLFCQLEFWGTLGRFLPQVLGVSLIGALLCGLMVWLANRYIRSQMGAVEMLLNSVQDLEKRIYQNEKPDDVDFTEIINLTSKGLTDGLTSVITRTVFLNQLPIKIKALKEGELGALCFVDVDDLKALNDNYGHGVGDMTLKNIGYVLREYEKKHNGLVGRYGGDEFILLLTELDSFDSLKQVAAELTMALHSEVSADGAMICAHCSVGVTSCTNADEDMEALIRQADEMLYAAKQSGKRNYQLYSK